MRQRRRRFARTRLPGTKKTGAGKRRFRRSLDPPGGGPRCRRPQRSREGECCWSALRFLAPFLVFIGIWATGSTQVIFLAGLQNIPRVYYEALEIDGGNAVHKFFYVTLPMISPTLFFNLVMGIISALQVFSQAYILTEGGPNNASLFYVYNLWREAFKYMSMGKACAMSWLLFLVVLVLTLLVFGTSKKWVYYEGEG